MSGRYVIAGTFATRPAAFWYDRLAETVDADDVLTLPAAGLMPIWLSVRRLAERVGPGAVLIGHSQGGTAAALMPGTAAVVTLGAPLAWPWPVPAQNRPMLSIVSRSDRVVPGSMARVAQGERWTFDRPGHIEMVRDGRILYGVGAWLDDVAKAAA